MKLQALIKPRKDGTISLLGQDGKEYEFTGDDLICDVTDEATIQKALASGNFAPADEADYDAAEELVAKAAVSDKDDDEDDEDDDEGAVVAAPPIEAGTPPKRYKPAANKKAK